MKLRSSAAFNPFDRLKIISGSDRNPEPRDYRSDVYERGMKVRQLVEEQGFQRARNMLAEQSTGNADRILRTSRDFIPADGYHLTSEEVYQRYQESVSRQLVA